jgi:hypothetical protein
VNGHFWLSCHANAAAGQIPEGPGHRQACSAKQRPMMLQKRALLLLSSKIR